MNILTLKEGFSDTQGKRKAEFFNELQKLLHKPVHYRGNNEAGPFHTGFLQSAEGDTVVFWNGNGQDSGEFVYPYWEVMVTVR